jgi:hypothetical protein
MKMLSKKESYSIDQEIDRCLNEMKSFSVDTDKYRNSAANLKVLYEARGVKSHKSLSTDTVVGVVGNLVGILLVLNFERSGAVLSKAFGMIGKGSKGA